MLETSSSADRHESVTAGHSITLDPPVEGVEIRSLVSSRCGARNFSTSLVIFQLQSVLPYHIHDCSEAITVLSGTATVRVEGRDYQLQALDCVHVPKDVAHSVSNGSSEELKVHTAFGSASPGREFVAASVRDNRGVAGPESIRRKTDSDLYELSPGAYFTDLFAHRFGSVGICGGYGRFNPGSSLPCHIHEYDESITIVEGNAKCLVNGKAYELSGLETAFVPTHRPHRFINESSSHMAMIWVYAGDEPDRVLLDNSLCSGSAGLS